jgi:glycosyltransferase involved in cell wall biosynthesis
MRVAFDEQIFAIQPYGGISRMFAELAAAFIDDPELGVELLPLNAPVINRYVLEDEHVRRRLAVHDAGHEYRSLWRYFRRIQPRRGLDIAHNTFYLPHGLASYPGARRIVTIHDMIPELLPQTRRRLDFLTLTKRYVQHADHIICVSEATRRDLVRVYPQIKAPISVIHHGVDSRFQPGAPRVEGLPMRYILFVGQRSQYKDADVLLRAFASIGPEHPDVHLVFVGGGAFTASERSQMSTLNISDRVHHASLSDADMVGAYGHADVFVFPSRFEGFGMPALEAMACGTATILTDATSLPEVGGDVALYFPTGDASVLATRISKVLGSDELRRDMQMRGLARAEQFTWGRAARLHVDAYEKALAAR